MEVVNSAFSKNTWKRRAGKRERGREGERGRNLLVFWPGSYVSILTCSRGDQYDLSNRIELGEFALPNWPH